MSETPHDGPTHGGPDAGLEIRLDFSTNAHPLGANARVRSAVEKCDRTRYPDPSYARLRALLGAFHNVVPQRIVVGASASELIWRLTHAGKLGGATDVITDERTFGEYRRAALGIGLAVASTAAAWRTSSAALHWLCDPDSPSGEPRDEAVRGALPAATGRVSDLVIVDLAYQPFRALMTESGEYPGLLSTAWADDVVQLWSPNKLHGLTGVRGAYLVLPVRAHPLGAALGALAPSWALGADGVAMLQAHADPKSILHLRRGAPKLNAWKSTLDRLLTDAGWERQPSPLHYGLFRPPLETPGFPGWFDYLRMHGIKVRDATSFGRPGWVRLRACAPAAVRALVTLTERYAETGTSGSEPGARR